MTADTPLPWLRISALVSLLAGLAVVALGWDRSFWYDEVFTLGAAAPGRPFDWAPLLGDVHPPTYILLVRALGALTGPEPAIRAVNLLTVLPLLAAWVVLRPVLETNRRLLLFALLLGSGYFLTLILDLRAYALLLALSLLSQAVLHAHACGRRQVPALAVTAALLTGLHFFGAAIGIAHLTLAAALDWRDGRRGAAAGLLLAGAALAAATLVWAFGIARTAGLLGGEMWITNDLQPFLDFASLQLPLLLVLLSLLPLRRLPVPETGAPLVVALAAPAMVLAVAAVISLHTPVISGRNLVVCVPGVTLAAVLRLPAPLLERFGRSPTLALALLLSVGLYTQQAVTDRQMIRWAVQAATPPECEGAPIQVLQPDIVDRFAMELFSAHPRPTIDFSDPVPDLPPGCDIVAMGWHQLGPVSDVTAFYAQQEIATKAVLPPDPALAETGEMTHGFVIRRVTSP